MIDTDTNKTTAVKVGDIPDYNAEHDYFATTIKGDCLDHDDCPMRIKDGDLLLCERMERRLFIHKWQQYQNEIILVVPCVPNSLHINHGLVKQFVGVEHGLFLNMRMFNPPMRISIPIDEIKEIAIVNKVIQS